MIWGFFLIESMYQYILFIGISLIFFLSSYTTGLGGKSYYYKSKNLGLGGYAIKHHSYSEITDYRIYEKYDDIVLVFIHKNFETKMKFSIKDKEKIHTIIDGRNNE